MRMWLADPKKMCSKHIIAEHAELHIFLGAILKRTSMKGFIEHNLLEPSALSRRHKELLDEMNHRGYTHKSLLLKSKVEKGLRVLPDIHRNHLMDKAVALNILISRCPECKRLHNNN